MTRRGNFSAKRRAASAQPCGRAAGGCWGRIRLLLWFSFFRTPPRSYQTAAQSALRSVLRAFQRANFVKNSTRTPHRSVRSAPIGQQIIGRVRGRVPRAFRAIRGRFRLARLAVPVLQQPARQHGRRILFNPLVDHGRNFLSQVGRMAQPAELIALQAVARRRQQEFPRRLNPRKGHDDLQGCMRCLYGSSVVILVKAQPWH